MSLIKPSLAVERIKKLDSKITIAIYALLGIAIMLFHAHTTHAGKVTSAGNIFLFSILLGPFVGNFSGWLSTSVYYGLSKNFFILDEGVLKRDVWTTIAYTNIGLIFCGVLTVIQFFVFGEPLFAKMDMDKYVDVSMTYYYAMEIMKIILLAWAFIFSVWVLSKILHITVVQALTVNFVSVLLIYGLGRIVLYIIVMIIIKS